MSPFLRKVIFKLLSVVIYHRKVMCMIYIRVNQVTQNNQSLKFFFETSDKTKHCFCKKCYPTVFYTEHINDEHMRHRVFVDH